MTHSLRVTKIKPELIGQRPIIIIYQVLFMKLPNKLK